MKITKEIFISSFVRDSKSKQSNEDQVKEIDTTTNCLTAIS